MSQDNNEAASARAEDSREPAPANSLPSWVECERLIENSEFHKRHAERFEGARTPEPTALHRFIYEYDDANSYSSAWFLHRLELVIKEATSAPVPRVVGNTSNESPDSAHIAPQAAADTGAASDVAGAKLPALPTAFATTRRVDGSLCNVYSPNQMSTYALTYGAQQREAGRQSQIARIRHLEHERDEARTALARQPVSEGLTPTCWIDPIELRELENGTVAMVVPIEGNAKRIPLYRVALAAVPPAKAERLTDEQIDEMWSMAALDPARKQSIARQFARILLAQQAKGVTK